MNIVGERIETTLYVDYELVNKRREMERKNKFKFYLGGVVLFLSAFLMQSFFTYIQVFGDENIDVL